MHDIDLTETLANRRHGGGVWGTPARQGVRPLRDVPDTDPAPVLQTRPRRFLSIWQEQYGGPFFVETTDARQVARLMRDRRFRIVQGSLYQTGKTFEFQASSDQDAREIVGAALARQTDRR